MTKQIAIHTTNILLIAITFAGFWGCAMNAGLSDGMAAAVAIIAAGFVAPQI